MTRLAFPPSSAASGKPSTNTEAQAAQHDRPCTSRLLLALRSAGRQDRRNSQAQFAPRTPTRDRIPIVQGASPCRNRSSHRPVSQSLTDPGRQVNRFPSSTSRLHLRVRYGLPRRSATFAPAVYSWRIRTILSSVKCDLRIVCSPS